MDNAHWYWRSRGGGKYEDSASANEDNPLGAKPYPPEQPKYHRTDEANEEDKSIHGAHLKDTPQGNVKSIDRIPEWLLPRGELRRTLHDEAERGEDTYAYTPVRGIDSKGRPVGRHSRWNVWRGDQRWAVWDGKLYRTDGGEPRPPQEYYDYYAKNE